MYSTFTSVAENQLVKFLTSIDAFKILYPLFNPDTIRLQEQFVVLYLYNASTVIELSIVKFLS